MTNKIYHFIGPVVIIALWFLVTYFHLISPLFVASPIDVVKQLADSLVGTALYADIGYTLYRLAFGFLLAVLIGTPLGLLMGYSNRVYHSLEFVIEFCRSVPVTALFPLFLLFFGIGDTAKIAVTAWGAGLIIVVNSMHGVHLGKELRLRAAKTMKVKGFQLFSKVIFPEALPQIMTGYRVALSIALVVVVVTEMFIGTAHGLGHRIIDAQLVYRIPDMYASILLTGVLGFVLNKFLIATEKHVVHWKGK